MKQLKEQILKEKLGGDRRELWWLIKRSKLGLIDQGQSELSTVTEEEAKAFMTAQ
jgi:ATP-dependent DNA helicase 2 subunit 2